MPTLSVDQYHIFVQPIAYALSAWLAQQPFVGIVVLCDTETEQYCRPRIENALSGYPTHYITIPSGEAHKQLPTCEIIWRGLFEAGANRNWCMLNLGGGVIGDMGGFCAATFKRGISFAQIPTTLLSQVDASVGGKLAVDYGPIKNSIGLFRNPSAVFIDTDFLQTLPINEVRSGYAEMLKHALIADAEQWKVLREIKQMDGVDWPTHLLPSLDIKRRIVIEDPHEKSIRKALNFGHTIGHALEGYRLETPQPLLHGEAIAAGMVCESYLSHQQTKLSKSVLDEISSYLIELYGHERIPEVAFAELIHLMKQDKKNEDSRINFSLLSDIGQVLVNQTATEEMILASLEYYNGLPG